MRIVANVFLHLFAFFIRFYLSKSPPARKFLAARVEISTPANSWRRVQEGLAMLDNGLDPYEGDSVHDAPFLLSFLQFLSKNLDPHLDFVFPLVDFVTALLLSAAARRYVAFLFMQQVGEAKSMDKAALKKLSAAIDPNRVAILVKFAYLYNPFAIVSCAAKTTTVFGNFLVAATLWCTVKGFLYPAVVCVLAAAQQCLYLLILTFPVSLWFAESRRKRGASSTVVFCSSFIAACLLGWVFVAYLTQLLSGSWNFVQETFGFTLGVPDLTPNVGLFWYFFTEMFDHFRAFFLWVFQLNVFVYALPLTICLRDDPVLLFHQMAMLTTVFKSYPCVGDAALYLSWLPAFSHLYHYIRHGFVVGCTLLCCAVLAPLMWLMWIYWRAANANFFFAVTLLYNTAQIFLLTDLLYSHLRRKFHLRHGLKPKNPKGDDARVILE